MPRRFAILAGLCLLPACFGGSYVPVARYALDPRFEVEPRETLDLSLSVRTFNAAQPYREPMVYRDARFRLDVYRKSEWAESPRDAVTRAIADAIVATKRFRDVGYAPDMRTPDLSLTGQLRRFDEDRTASPPEAVCEVRVELRQGLERIAVWSDTVTVRAPIETAGEREGAGLAAAMNEAVGRMASQVAARIAAQKLSQLDTLEF